MAAQTNMDQMSSALGLRGFIAVLFGIAAVFWPQLTLVTLLYIFSTFLLLSGIVTLVAGIIEHSDKSSSMGKLLTVLVGVVEIGVGVYLLRHVHVAFATFILLIAFTLIFRGLVEVFRSLSETNGTALYKTASVLVGFLAIVAGILILFQPVTAGVAFVWILGIYALITGPLMIAAAIDLSKKS